MPDTKRKHSRKRDAILSVIRSTDRHPSAEWVYDQVRREYPDISLATVYRNLAEFKRDGLVRTVCHIDGHDRFDGDVSEHSHFICTLCGSVIDIVDDISFPLDDISERTGLDIKRLETSFYGICPDCKNGGANASA